MEEISSKPESPARKVFLAQIPAVIKISAGLVTVIAGIIGILMQLGIINPITKYKSDSSIQVGTTLVVENNQAFFYTTANPNTRNNSYLITGDQVTVLDIAGEFVLVNFYNSKVKKTSKGYIRIADTKLLE